MPFLVALVGMVLIGRHSDRTGERKGHVAACALTGAAGLVLAAVSGSSVPIIVFAFALSQLGQRSVQGVFWAIPPIFLGGTAAAAGIALINSIGNLGGFVGPSVMGWLRQVSGSCSAGLLVLASALIIEAVLVMSLRLPANLDGKRNRPAPLDFAWSVCHACRGSACRYGGEPRRRGLPRNSRRNPSRSDPAGHAAVATSAGAAARYECPAGQRRPQTARGGRPGRDAGRAGTRIKVPTRTDVRELCELREALESQAARLFAERATATQRRELRRLAEHVDALFVRLSEASDDNGFRFDVHRQHLQFHMWIAEHANSHLLKQMIERKHVLILNWMFDITARRTPLPPGFHSRLAEGLVSGDVEKADALMREHVRYRFRLRYRGTSVPSAPRNGASDGGRRSNGPRHTRGLRENDNSTAIRTRPFSAAVGSVAAVSRS